MWRLETITNTVSSKVIPLRLPFCVQTQTLFQNIIAYVFCSFLLGETPFCFLGTGTNLFTSGHKNKLGISLKICSEIRIKIGRRG